MDEELEVLGPIGFKNAKEPYTKFPEAIAKVDQMCKDLCQKLYTGENTKYLVGADKIPEYLSTFLEHMKKQSEEFKISQVRQLRTSSENLQNLCSEIPHSIFNYLKTRSTARIEQAVTRINTNFEQKHAEDSDLKQEHLRMFRPNLENPANKQMTEDLNVKEQKRTEEFVDVSAP